jgi:hypothetical protein
VSRIKRGFVPKRFTGRKTIVGLGSGLILMMRIGL